MSDERADSTGSTENTESTDWADRTDPTLDIRTTDTQHIENTLETMSTGQTTNTGDTMNAAESMTEQQASNEGQVPLRVEPTTPVPDDVVPPEDAEAAGAAVLPHLQAPPPPPTTASWPPPQQAPQAPGLVTVRRGPLPLTIMLGLLSLIVAAYVLVTNLTTADLNLRIVGPTMFGAVGALLLIVGLIGVLAGGRGRGSD